VSAITREGEWLLLAVKARPGARVDRIRGIAGELLLVDVAAPPEDGRATERLLAFLAESFGVARRDVALVSGAHARWKRIRLHRPQRWPEGLPEG
jgi:hypothetical protein